MLNKVGETSQRFTSIHATPSKNALLWLLTCLSAAGNLATGLFHDIGPPAVQATVLTLPLLLFAFAHGSIQYRFRDVLVFAIICVAVSNAFENLSIVTEFPFGGYYYSEMLGPKIFQVPVLIGPAFFAVGYLSWTLARVILRATGQRRGGALYVQRAARRSPYAGGVEFLVRPAGIHCQAGLDLERGRKLLRRSGGQFPRLVFDRLCILPTLRILPASTRSRPRRS